MTDQTTRTVTLLARWADTPGRCVIIRRMQSNWRASLVRPASEITCIGTSMFDALAQVACVAAAELEGM